MAASERGHAQIVRILIDAKADLNARDKSGSTAIIIASSKGQPEAVRVLIDAKADLNIKDHIGTALARAMMDEGHTEIIELLKGAGAEASHTDHDEYTALMVDMEASVLCPHCEHVVLSVDSDGDFDGDSVSPCEHLVYLWIDSGGGFEVISEEFEKWLTDQEKANENFEEYDVVSKVAKNPFVDTIIEHEVGIAAYYGFKKDRQK